MNNYTNNFQCFINRSKNEAIIHFSQQSPVMDEKDSVIRVAKEPITSLVMRIELATALKDTLTELLSPDKPSA